MSLELFVDPGTEIVRSAILSPDGLYRYRLGRTWDATLPPMVWVMLNPSTADAEVDDPTIRRCMGFAKREGCGGIEVLNLFALRATKPVHLFDGSVASDPNGPHNYPTVRSVVRDAYARDWPVVTAWGAHAGLDRSNVYGPLRRALWVPETLHLGSTKGGHPRHPLYVRADAELVPWVTAAASEPQEVG